MQPIHITLFTSMPTYRIIQLIEKDSELIIQRLLERVHSDPEVPNYQSLTDIELRTRARDLLTNLGSWLGTKDASRLNQRYEQLGAARHREEMPLHEVVYKLHILRRLLMGHARDEHLEVNALQLYGEQEFLCTLGEFFDRIVYSVVKGYSEAEIDRKQGNKTPN